MGAIAKLFKNGGSQAVRLPKDFRFEGDEVEITRQGDSVVISPIVKRKWPENYWGSWKDLELEIIKPLPSKSVPEL